MKKWKGSAFVTLVAACAGAWGSLIWAPASFAQVMLSGRVTDPDGLPVAGADLDLFEAQSGRKIDLGSQNDNTAIDGTYTLSVTPDIYHVRFEAPLTREDLAPRQVRDVVLGADLTLDAQLPTGVRMTGRVTGPEGLPVPGVDLDLIDPVSGVKIPTVRDDTNADGLYAFTVEPGVWHVSFSPPLGAGAGPLRVNARDITANTVLDVALPRGFTVTGRIVDGTGRTIPGADLDAELRAGRRPVPLSDDETGFDGIFAVTLPEGEIDLFVTPPNGAPFAPGVRRELAVTEPLDIGDLIMSPGHVLAGVVLDPNGTPVAGADLDLYAEESCDSYPAIGGTTDAAGAFAVRVLDGAWEVHISDADPLPERRFAAVEVVTDVTTELRYPNLTEQVVSVASRIVDPSGVGVAGVRVEGESLSGGATWDAITDDNGDFATTAYFGEWSLRLVPPDGSTSPARVIEPLELPCGLPSTLDLEFTPPPPVVSLPAGVLYAQPNPWRGSTSIGIELGQARTDATVAVHDIRGRRVRVLARGGLAEGSAQIPWDGLDASGRPVASGIYFVSVSGGGERLAAKIARIAP